MKKGNTPPPRQFVATFKHYSKKYFKSILPTVGSKNELNRNLWVKRILYSLPKKSKILDAGAGEQIYKCWCKHLIYTSQDFCQYDGTGNDVALQLNKWDTSKVDIVSDITNIPVEDNTFDGILCTEVFEHLPYPIDAIKEFNRILKPTGKLILTAPFCSLSHMAPYHYYSGFSRYFYEKVLSENGFKIIKIEPNGGYFEYIAQEIRRCPSIQRKYYKKNIISLFANILGFILLYFLNVMSKHDKGSSDVLCFGWHILAEKL